MWRAGSLANGVVRAAGARRMAGALLFFFAFVVGGAGTAGAQYFGRNKVQHRSFKFEVLKTEHFDIYFYEDERAAVADVARMAERWYARLSQLLGADLARRQPIVLYASHPDFEQTNVLAGLVGEGTGGVTEGLKRRVVLPLAGTLAETDHVLGHELVHAFQYSLAEPSPDQPGGSSLDRLPLWFVEGMAEYLSVGPADPHTAMWLRDAARERKLPEIGRLDDPRYFPYRWGQALWAFIAGRWGDEAVGRIFLEALRAGAPEEGFRAVLGLSSKELSQAWHEAVYGQYAPLFEVTRRAADHGRALAPAPSRAGGLNVSPVLSPDGRRIAFLSERGLLSVDLYVADADTGRILRKLTDTAVDPHFSSIQFIGSAGSWHPAGRQLVIGAVRAGRPVLVIFDVERGRVAREIPFPALGEIFSPAWSPDGRRIAFSATSGGFTDLFLYDLDTGTLRRLTADQFADLQPAWAPDGQRLAFVTDRFTTSLALLAPGPYRLALLDIASGRLDPLPTFEVGKSINPQWAADGRRVYFLSDRTGITNVYVIDVTTGELRQVTNLDAGVSGITPLSPALSAAVDTRRLAFSAYENGRLDIYVLDDPAGVAGGPLVSLPPRAAAGILPPADRASSELMGLLVDGATGLPAETGTVAPYRPRLSLDWVGQPFVSAGVSRFGPTFGGGLSFLWSDMLGNHKVMATIDANTYGFGVSDLFKNTGGLVAYENLTHRWDWGLSVEQWPYLAGTVVTGVTRSGGQPALVEQTVVQRQTFRGATALLARPFSQAHRVELGGGYQQVSFEEQVRTITTSLRTGRVLSDVTETTPLGATLDLVQASAAFVVDTAVFGATSPVAGQRARFEVAPTLGSLSFTSALADYRRYVAPVPFYTIATRLLHFGRYGPGADDVRLVPLYLGYPELVRGYGLGSFTAADCVPTSESSCPAFDRLLGSRLLVGNLELRFPLLRPFGVSSRMYGPLPLEVALFADGGVAWSRGERPALFGGDRAGVASAGVTFRTNVLGFAVVQIDLAYPFQRPGRGWVWAFSLTPGF
jgi:Tol biopolymer transport system component